MSCTSTVLAKTSILNDYAEIEKDLRLCMYEYNTSEEIALGVTAIYALEW